jgi:hypothetical protein
MRICPLRRLEQARRAAGGFTLTDFVVASGVAIICLTGLLALVLQVGEEQRRIVGDGTMQQEAGLLQDKLSVLIRSMSNTESVTFGNPIASAPSFYRRIIVARGEAPDYPREEICFNPTNHTVIHDPNRSASGDEVVLFTPSPTVVVRDLYFYPSLKVGGLIDSTTLNVVLEVDDDGYTSRKDATGNVVRTAIHRYFSVKMRSN